VPFILPLAPPRGVCHAKGRWQTGKLAPKVGGNFRGGQWVKVTCSAFEEIIGRVAPAGFPTGALAGSGQGDFHHPALPDQTAHGGRAATRTSSGDMPSQVKAWFMFPSCGSFLPTGRLRSTGSACPALPGFNATIQPSDFPSRIGRSSGSPRLWPTSGRTLFCTGRRCVRQPAARRRLSVRVLRNPDEAPRTVWDLPGYWVVRGRRAVVVHPAGCVAPSPSTGDDDCCLPG
jgi:hypothetical protein